MSSLLQDLRYGFRLLVRERGFTSVAAIVLALGIGANTAVFTLVNGLLLKPLAGHPNGEVVGLYSKDGAEPDKYRAFSYPNYADLRAHTEVFAALAAHNMGLAGLTEGDTTRRVCIDITTGNFFDTFGAPIAIGRTFTLDEERPGADIPVTILSDSAWQRLGGSKDVLGRTVKLNSRAFTIIGVAPRGFGGSMALVTPDFWVPTGVYDTISNDFMREGLATPLADRRHHNLIVIARLAPGATIASAAPALEAAGAAFVRAFPVENKDQTLQLAPLARMAVSTRPHDDSELSALTVALLSMSAIVLVIASFNLANMLLARGAARRKEFAIRLAIGGGRMRLVRQLLTEGFVLALVGGAGGLLLAMAATKALVAAIQPLSPVTLTFASTPDVRVFLATLGFCAISTVIFGLFPAWKLARTDALPELKDQGDSLRQGRRSRFSLPDVLVMVQLACSLALLAVAGLFMRGAAQTASADPGFTLDRGVMVQVDASLAGYDTTRGRAIYTQMLERLRARPDVRVASLGSIVPFGEIQDGVSVQKAGAPIAASDPRAAAELIATDISAISRDYFASLGLNVLRGRDFTAVEETAEGGPRVAIIDEPLARRLFGDEDPVGRSVQFARRDDSPPAILHVVGVASGVRQNLFDQAPTPHIYVPFGQDYQANVYVHLTTTAPTPAAEAALLPGVRSTLQSVDASLPILALETRPMFRDRNLMFAIVRIGASIFAVFGVAALALAAAGVYGVKAYVVARRTREIGVRMALGATSRDVLWMVMREGLTLGICGLVLGVGFAVLAGIGMQSLIYQGRTADTLIIAGALGVLLVSVLLATWAPARRATKIAPTVALRT